MTTQTETMIPLKAQQMEAVLVNAIKAHIPMCVTGAPGIGKSQIIARAAQLAGFKLLTLHPVTSDPTDFKGLPVMTVNGAEFSAYGDLRTILEATEPLTVFFDDLGNASNAVQSALMHLVEARRINQHVIPDCVTFVAATNRKKDKTSVSGMIEALKKRFTMLELLPDREEWALWAASNGIDSRIIAFLNFKSDRPDFFLNEEPTPDMSVNANPRGWERVSRHLALSHPTDCLPAVFAGCVGKETGATFASFIRQQANMVMPEVVFADPDNAPIPQEPSCLWALMTALANKVTPATVGAYCTYLKRLVADKREYAMLSIKLMVARDPSLQSGKEYVDAASGPLGRLMMTGKR